MSTPNTPGGFPPYQGGGNPYEPSQPQPPAAPPYGQPQQPSYGETQPYSQPSTYPQQPSFGEQTNPSGQPSYGQPPMGAPMGQPYAPMGQPIAPPPPAKKSRRGLWMTLGIIAGVLILACALVGVLIVKPIADKTAAVVAAATEAGSFCNDLKAQNYTDAYSQLSSAYQGTIPQDQFTQGAKLHDQIDGQVTACGTPNSSSSTGVSINSANTQVTLTVTMTRKQTYTGNIVLVKSGSAWKIDKIADTLQGTDLGALQTASAFCTALVKSDFQTAYGLLSAAQQSQSTEQDFADSFTSSFKSAGLTLTGCTPDLGTYSVSGSTAMLKSTLDVSLSGVTTSVPITLSFKQEGGAWKIDNIDIPQQ